MTTATQEKPVEVNTRTKKIAARVKGGKIIKVSLGEIRDEFGAGRIGKNVLGHMSEYLAEQGVGAFPAWLMDPEQNPEPRQHHEVWVYERDGSARSALIDAFGDPESNDLPKVLDLFLGEAQDFGSMDAETRLALVRAAVCS